MDRVEARIANRLDEMPVVVAMVDRFGVTNQIPAEVLHDLNVALDEALNNVITHAFAAGELSEITVRVSLRSGEVTAEVVDAGPPFDPLQAPAPDLALPLRTRRPGGIGIHFIRTLMDEVGYARIDGMNVLRMIKRLPQG